MQNDALTVCPLCAGQSGREAVTCQHCGESFAGHAKRDEPGESGHNSFSEITTSSTAKPRRNWQPQKYAEEGPITRNPRKRVIVGTTLVVVAGIFLYLLQAYLLSTTSTNRSSNTLATNDSAKSP